MAAEPPPQPAKRIVYLNRRVAFIEPHRINVRPALAAALFPLFGLLLGRAPSETVTGACAVGGASTEAADGTSSVPSWPDIERRLQRGWRRKAATPGPGWSPSREPGLWHGPRDTMGAD